MAQKRALIIRHAPDEGLAGLREPVEAAGYRLERIDVTGPAFAGLDLGAPDLLILMGGPMGVYEQDRHPWIAGELARLSRRLEADGPTLGICLGSQMMAASLGAEVYRGPAMELGFHAVQIHESARGGPLRHIAGVPVLHWHGDTFALPEGVELLASTPLYAHQAFRRGRNLLALQFHPEMGLDPRFDAWVDHSPDEIRKAGLDEVLLRAQHERLGPAAVAAGRAMIAEWLAGL